jgi:hypothetical protein
LEARGLHWHATVSDGAPAMQQACATVDPDGQPSVLVFNETDRCESFVYEGEENHS